MRKQFYQSIARLGAKLGFEGTARAGEAAGWLLWHTHGSRRRLACEAISQRLELPRAQAEHLARASFGHTCRSFLEALLARRVDQDFLRDRLEIVNPEILAASQTDSRPAVAVTAHLGAWELMGGLTPLLYAARPSRAVVIRRPRDQALYEVMTELRASPSVRYIEHRGAAKPVLKTLKEGGVCAFLVDHNCTRRDAVFLPFLGKIAAVNKGPALLAVRAGAVVWPAILVRREPGRYTMVYDEPLDTAELQGDNEEKVLQTAQFYTRTMERRIREYPEQWFWMHKRWKTRPPEEEGEDTDSRQ